MSPSRATLYVEPPDIPEGLTLAEHRRRRREQSPAPRGRVSRWRERLRDRRAASPSR